MGFRVWGCPERGKNPAERENRENHFKSC